ncbi:hypothetical protein M0812_25255 [Anaeramoeba flamelloides]|uniref:Transposase n=1 Tax=Anaeramoeba flamelloides TaxID=1746091 RepID=A0AAV7YJI5_9EUKA|nr:hypothetical protein M0812_25255 [Anaeramoeba flamelloides]
MKKRNQFNKIESIWETISHQSIINNPNYEQKYLIAEEAKIFGIRNISRKYNIPKSTLSDWCRSNMLPSEQIKRLKQRGRKSNLTESELQDFKNWVLNQNRKGIICGGNECIDYLYQKYAWKPRGDILIMDNLGVHHYSKGVQKIKDQGIKIKYLHPYSATHLSPLDNSVFKILEDKLRSNGGRRFANYFDKIETVNRLWKTITSKQVKNQFKKCELPYCRVKYSNKDDKDDKIILSRLIEDIINREEERQKEKKKKIKKKKKKKK